MEMSLVPFFYPPPLPSAHHSMEWSGISLWPPTISTLSEDQKAWSSSSGGMLLAMSFIGCMQVPEASEGAPWQWSASLGRIYLCWRGQKYLVLLEHSGIWGHQERIIPLPCFVVGLDISEKKKELVAGGMSHGLSSSHQSHWVLAEAPSQRDKQAVASAATFFDWLSAHVQPIKLVPYISCCQRWQQCLELWAICPTTEQASRFCCGLCAR